MHLNSMTKLSFYCIIIIVRTEYFGEIKAVAFDIDGTLYKELPFNILVMPHFIKHLNFFLEYNKVRKELRKNNTNGFYEDFNFEQSRLLAEKLKCSPEQATEKLNKLVYEGLKKYYLKLKPYKGALEFIRHLKEQGLKVALLSDFPPEQKGEIWGIKQYCDFLIGSEQTGALKPSPYVFSILQKTLNEPAENILYVGNNFKYDIVGSKNAGMKAAWIITPSKKISEQEKKLADVVFYDYSELETKFFEKK